MDKQYIIPLINKSITQKQLIVLIVAVFLVVIVLALAKKIMRVALTVAIIAGALVYFGIASPEQVGNASKIISSKGIEKFKEISDNTEFVSIKTSESGELEIKFYANNTWYDVNDIASYVKTSDGSLSIKLKNGETVNVDDKDIIKLIKLLRK